MNKLIYTSLCLFLLQACSENTPTNVTHEEKKESKTIELNWEVTGLSAPESAVYDSTKNIIYVSNVNGSPMEKDENGFISTISPEGEIIELNWVEGLNAPKGLSLFANKLYVADIDTLVVIDTNSGEIIGQYQDEDAKFLNDVTITKDGKVFVSDMMTNKIHCLDGESFNVWLSDEKLISPNGLHAETDQLIVGSWGVMTDGFATDVPGHLLTVDLNTKSIANLGNGQPIGNLDGVEAFGEDFLVTDWMVGKLFQIDRTGKAELLLELEQGMADHEFIADKNLVLLPMMMNDKLLAYSLSTQ